MAERRKLLSLALLALAAAIATAAAAQEPQEIGLKTQLGGGRLIVNKKTWYAHLHKGSRYGRMYHLNKEERQAIVDAHNYSSDYWMNNKWEGRIHDMEWLVEKFWPMPTWPSNLRDT